MHCNYLYANSFRKIDMWCNKKGPFPQTGSSKAWLCLCPCPVWLNKNLKGCFWKQITHKRTKISDLVLLSLFIYCSGRMYTSPSTGLSHYENTPISNIQKFSPPKNENFQIKNSDIFQISAQNIDCGYSLGPPQRGGSNDNQQSMFWAEIQKNNVYPSKPQFYYIKWGLRGHNYIGMFLWWVFDF